MPQTGHLFSGAGFSGRGSGAVWVEAEEARATITRAGSQPAVVPRLALIGASSLTTFKREFMLPETPAIFNGILKSRPGRSKMVPG